MNIYFPGQRWISETEPELGMGLVIDVATRTVAVLYHTADETRHYAINNAPLNRVQFATGDEIASQQNERIKKQSSCTYRSAGVQERMYCAITEWLYGA